MFSGPTLRVTGALGGTLSPVFVAGATGVMPGELGPSRPCESAGYTQTVYCEADRSPVTVAVVTLPTGTGVLITSLKASWAAMLYPATSPVAAVQLSVTEPVVTAVTTTLVGAVIAAAAAWA